MKRICANCEYNDGMVYTSLPPMYKCTITGEYNHGFQECDVKFAPVKQGQWINVKISISGDSSAECSLCGAVVHNNFSNVINYCPNCGAVMYEGGTNE